MKKKEFYGHLMGVVDCARTEIAKENELAEAWREKERSGKYSAQHIRENIAPVIANHEKRIGMMVSAAQEKLSEIANEYADELASRDVLCGEDITEDAKLLNCGVKLGKKDVEGLIRKNAGNYTMHQLLHKYSKENGLDIDKHLFYMGHANEVESARTAGEICSVAVRNWRFGEKAMNDTLKQVEACYNVDE